MVPIFNDEPVLEDETILLRPLVASDLPALQEVAADPVTWAGHPAKDRHKPDVFAEYFVFLLNAGGTLAVISKEEERVIGCSRYYVSPDVPDKISIGFTFIENRFWGGETNRKIKRLMLDHAFETFDEVWFHIDPTNIRSQKATAKLGAECIVDRELNLAGNPAEWKCWRLTKSKWANRSFDGIMGNEAIG